MSTTLFDVPSISCGHCKSSIEGALRPAHGVESADVDIEAKTVTVSYDPELVEREALIALIEQQGYEVKA